MEDAEADVRRAQGRAQGARQSNFIPTQAFVDLCFGVELRVLNSVQTVVTF